VSRYSGHVDGIRSFRRPALSDFFPSATTDRRAGWTGVAKNPMTRKLDILHYAQTVDDLRSPPANRLEVFARAT